VRLPPGLAALALVALTSSARAQAPEEEAARRLVLVAMPESVHTATAVALDPWAIPVDTSEAAPPASNAEASEIAHEHGATTVAWLDHGELVIYDDERGVSERHAAADPLDDAAAASIALSIKTSMRRPDDPEDTPAVVVVAVPTPMPVAEHPRFSPHVLAQIGGALPLGANDTPAMLRVAGRFSLDLPQVPRLAVTAGVEAGPAAPVEDDVMSGSYRDIAIAAGVEWRHPVGHAVWLVPSLSGTVHFTHLGGTSDMQRVSESAIPAGAQLEIGAETGRRVRAGVTVYGSFLAGGRTYKVRNTTVLTTPAATVGLALRISFQ
jgi:hypothetical protein